MTQNPDVSNGRNTLCSWVDEVMRALSNPTLETHTLATYNPEPTCPVQKDQNGFYVKDEFGRPAYFGESIKQFDVGVFGKTSYKRFEVVDDMLYILSAGPAPINKAQVKKEPESVSMPGALMPYDMLTPLPGHLGNY